jgi:competence protein ComEA
MKQFKTTSIVILAVLLAIGFCHPVFAATGKININTDSKEQLMKLKKVGAKIADRIIEYRKAQSFKKIEDLMEVKGIGQKVFDINKDMIIVKEE